MDGGEAGTQSSAPKTTILMVAWLDSRKIKVGVMTLLLMA